MIASRRMPIFGHLSELGDSACEGFVTIKQIGLAAA
jgi:hypothetical protein